MLEVHGLAPETNTGTRNVLPFTAFVNHDELKLALLLNAINPNIGGLLITGPKGTGKTTVVRSLAALLPEIPVVKGCQFRCAPDDATGLCSACTAKFEKTSKLPTKMQKMRVVNLPLSATEDRVVGSLDVERAIREGEAALKPGILADANQNILYVDEVNLLPDHIVDSLLDAAATGINVVEREGISVSHPARFIFIGSMNPEEGELRPQLLDRFPLHVAIQRPFNIEERVEIIQLNIDFERDPQTLRKKWAPKEDKLRADITMARERMKTVEISEEIMQVIAYLTTKLQVDGARPDIVIAKTAMAFAAFDGRTAVTADDVEIVAPLALSHRTRQRGILEPPSGEEIQNIMKEAKKKAKTQTPQSKDKDPYTKDDHEKLRSKFKQFHPLDSNQDGERFFGNPPRRGAAGRCSYTGFVCFFMVVAGAIGLLLPLPFPINFVFGGLISAGLVVLLERLYRYQRRPGSVMPALSQGDQTPDFKGKYRRAKHRGDSTAPPTTSSTPPKGKQSPTQPSLSGKAVSTSSLIRMDEGTPLFDFEDFLEPRYFGRQRAPKWSIRQVGRRAGSIHSRQTEGGVLLGSSLPQDSPRNIHIPATITAAALHTDPAIHEMPRIRIQPPDVREKRFQSWTPLTIIFVVDLSVSMLKSFDKLQLSLIAFKTCLEGTRDRVGLIALKDWGAVEVQAPTTNWMRLVAKFMTLRLSGYTPLAAGLKRAHESIQRERRRNPGTLPIIVVFSDFLPNIQLQNSDTPDIGLPEAIADVLHQCHLLSKAHIPLVTINLHHEFFPIKQKQHHDVILEWTRKRAHELNIPNYIEVGLKEDKLIPFLAFYMAYITQGRTYLGIELTSPTEIISEIHRIAQRVR
jgi:Mg-chelatase subunit ChlI/Mg-chelatase subunit ChlD